jgi:hypothetical protein
MGEVFCTIRVNVILIETGFQWLAGATEADERLQEQFCFPNIVPPSAPIR